MDRSKTNSQTLQKAICRTLIFGALALSGCATYQHNVDAARRHLEAREPLKAAELLAPLAQTPNDDQLVYVFDYATALQAAGQYKESNQFFMLADRLSDQKDYLSLSRFGGSLLMSEGMMQYKGEDHERLLINIMSALNFLMLGDREGAMVEIRRLNQKLEYYRIEEKKNYEQNTAALYLSALLWEAEKNWDSAYIDYERAYKRDPNIGYIREDLVRAAQRAGRSEAEQKWRREFGVKTKVSPKSRDNGELVVLYLQGWGPRKAERPRVVTANGFISPGLPMLVPVPSQTKKARVEVTEAAHQEPLASSSPVLHSLETQFIYSVQDTSIQTLEDAYAPLIAKRIAAIAAKEIAAHQVSQKNEGLGSLLRIAMHASDRADLRHWSTLPETIQVAKLELKPGVYKVRVQGLGQAGTETGESMEPVEVEIKPKSKTFISWRSFR